MDKKLIIAAVLEIKHQILNLTEHKNSWTKERIEKQCNKILQEVGGEIWRQNH